MNDTRQPGQRFRFTLRFCFVVIAIAAVAIRLGVYWFSETKLPAPTPAGASAKFDQHLRSVDAAYRFLFADGKKLMVVDTTGKVEQVVCDLATRLELSPAAQVHEPHQISPDESLLLIGCLDGDWQEDPTNRKLFVVDLTSGSMRPVEIPSGEYEFEMDRCWWLSDSSFVIGLIHYPPEGAHLWRVRILRYDLDQLDSPSVVDLGTERPSMCAIANRTLLFVDENERRGEWSVRVVDDHGVRAASAAETGEFEQATNRSWNRWAVHAPRGEITLKPVAPEEPLFGPWNDWDKDDIYLGQRWIRRSESSIAHTPKWDRDTELLIWGEEGMNGTNMYFADQVGRYRLWYPAEFLGKIKRRASEALE